MRNPLPSIKAKLMKELPAIDRVLVYEEPLSDAVRRHAIPNQVRVRVALEKLELRFGISGLIFAVNPQDSEGETGKQWAERLFPNDTPMVIPPFYYRKKESQEVEEWTSIVICQGERDIVAMSAFDEGLGSIVINRKKEVQDTIKEKLEWHPPIQEIRRVVAEVLHAHR